MIKSAYDCLCIMIQKLFLGNVYIIITQARMCCMRFNKITQNKINQKMTTFEKYLTT